MQPGTAYVWRGDRDGAIVCMGSMPSYLASPLKSAHPRRPRRFPLPVMQQGATGFA